MAKNSNLNIIFSFKSEKEAKEAIKKFEERIISRFNNQDDISYIIDAMFEYTRKLIKIRGD